MLLNVINYPSHVQLTARTYTPSGWTIDVVLAHFPDAKQAIRYVALEYPSSLATLEVSSYDQA